MSFNWRDEHGKDFDLYEKSLWEEDGKEDNVAAPGRSQMWRRCQP
jgi:hypothetical protein